MTLSDLDGHFCLLKHFCLQYLGKYSTYKVRHVYMSIGKCRGLVNSTIECWNIGLPIITPSDAVTYTHTVCKSGNVLQTVEKGNAVNTYSPLIGSDMRPIKQRQFRRPLESLRSLAYCRPFQMEVFVKVCIDRQKNWYGALRVSSAVAALLVLKKNFYANAAWTNGCIQWQSIHLHVPDCIVTLKYFELFWTAMLMICLLRSTTSCCWNDVYDMFRQWRCIRRWLGECTTNLLETSRNVDLLANFAYRKYAVNYQSSLLV